MDFCAVYILFFYILNNCAGSPSKRVLENIHESVMSSIADLKTKFTNRDINLKQELDVIAKKLRDVEQCDAYLRKTLDTIEDQFEEIKSHDEMNEVYLRRGNESLNIETSHAKRAFTLKPPTTMTSSTGSNHIAFTAFLSRDVHSLYNNLVVPFDDVTLNDGQGFDKGTHRFTCPVSGIYLFKSALYSLSQSTLEVDVVKEGVVIFRLYASGRYDDPMTSDQGFNSCSVRCNKGEMVWTEINELTSNNAVFPASKYSSFSGLLLWSY